MQVNERENDAYLAGCSVEEAALDAVLEKIPRAAFVCDDVGLVIRSNTRAKRLLAAEPALWASHIARAIEGDGNARTFEISRLSVPGHAPHFLLVAETKSSTRVENAVAAARRAWKITKREGQVLAGVVAGRSNRAIADELKLATRTIELHITSLLGKAGAASRSQLIVALWELSCLSDCCGSSAVASPDDHLTQ